VTLETRSHDAAGRRIRVTRQRERIVDLPLCDELVDVAQELARADRLPAQIEQLPDNNGETGQRRRAERIHHEATVAPRLGDLLGEGEVGCFDALKLQEHERKRGQTSQSYLRYVELRPGSGPIEDQ
jgi:hypothetical protein